MIRWIHIALLILSSFALEAQILSSKGRFSVAFDQGCSPMTVNITELDTFGNVTRQYYFFEGADITNDTTFTYNTPGVYQIVQVVGVDNIGDKSDTLFVEAFESRRPEVRVDLCSGFEISVTSIDSYYDSVRVYFGGPDSVTLLPNESTTYTFSSGTPQNFSLKGLFDNADDVCSFFTQEVNPIQTLSAPNIISASIKETCRDIYSLYLQIDQYDSAINYRINLDQGTPIQIFDGYLDSTLVIVPDINFNLSSYCLDIEAYDPCNASSSTSNQVCSEPSSLSLSPFESLYSSYEGSTIFVNLDQVSSGTFEVSRRFEGGDFQSRGSFTGSFSDEIGSITRKYFYQIDYRDSCNNILYSAETHPPHIETDLLTENQYQVVLTNANNSLTTLTESIYEVGNTGTISSEAVPSTQFDLRLNAKDGAPRQFLNIISNYNGTQIRSNSQILKYELIVHVPTAFTPNGDGLNDVLEFYGLPSENATISIYSRWGQLLFTSENPNDGWDGMISGTTAPEGTYLYEVIFETSEGKMLRQKGTFALINK